MKLNFALVGVAFGCVAAYAQVAPLSAAPSCDVLLRDIQGNTKLHVGERVAYFGSPVMSLRASLLDGQKTVMRTFECKTKEGVIVPDGRFTFPESNIERGAANLKPANDGTLYIVEGIVKGVTTFTERRVVVSVSSRFLKRSSSLCRANHLRDLFHAEAMSMQIRRNTLQRVISLSRRCALSHGSLT